MARRRFGVEEEFLLVSPDTGAPVSSAALVLSATDLARSSSDAAGGSDLTGGIEKELQEQQIEIDTVPVSTLDEARAEIRRLRSAAAAAAEGAGARLAALATSPIQVEPATTPVTRYEQMVELYQLTGAEQLTCGMHVHVETTSPEEAVGALDRIRPWLPVFLALTANSPFWHGRDTGYESYRCQAWSRWPSAGATDLFGSVEAYRRVLDDMLATGALLDDGMIYFDARLGRNPPTLEIRVADVCLDSEDSVLVAALSRALVDTAARAWDAGEEAVPVRAEVLRLATWRASRSGLGGELVDPRTGVAVPAPRAVGALREHVRDSLDEAGDLAEVDELLARLWHNGSGSTAQRAAFARHHSLSQVVQDAVERTTRFS